MQYLTETSVIIYNCIAFSFILSVSNYVISGIG